MRRSGAVTLVHFGRLRLVHIGRLWLVQSGRRCLVHYRPTIDSSSFYAALDGEPEWQMCHPMHFAEPAHSGVIVQGGGSRKFSGYWATQT
jgi:hypothetical protein